MRFVEMARERVEDAAYAASPARRSARRRLYSETEAAILCGLSEDDFAESVGRLKLGAANHTVPPIGDALYDLGDLCMLRAASALRASSPSDTDVMARALRLASWVGRPSWRGLAVVVAPEGAQVVRERDVSRTLMSAPAVHVLRLGTIEAQVGEETVDLQRDLQAWRPGQRLAHWLTTTSARLQSLAGRLTSGSSRRMTFADASPPRDEVYVWLTAGQTYLRAAQRALHDFPEELEELLNSAAEELEGARRRLAKQQATSYDQLPGGHSAR